ncbi:ATP-binding protein, partial [Neokomagataea sp. TBRC 2177]|nr:ATP-binding protein [Neokomagataea anthophila]
TAMTDETLPPSSSHSRPANLTDKRIIDILHRQNEERSNILTFARLYGVSIQQVKDHIALSTSRDDAERL